MLTDTWDDPTAERDELEDALAELSRVDEQLAIFKSRRDELKAAIVAAVQTEKRGELEPGDHVVERGEWRATVVVPETWTWDQEKLAELAPESAPHGYPVKVKRFVDKKAFEKADAKTQADLREALTRGPGAARVKVEARGE